MFVWYEWEKQDEDGGVWMRLFYPADGSMRVTTFGNTQA